MGKDILTDLQPELREKAEQVMEVCAGTGEFSLLIYCTKRTLHEQAVLYRQSRTRSAILAKMESLRSRGFGFLAEIIEQVGPRNGRHVTNAAPGESWHNYGLAFDAVPLLGGKPQWNYMEAKEYWQAYGEAVRQLGLQWAGDWTKFREYPHAQQATGGNPLRRKSPEEIRSLLDIA
jgi:peptidoglycan L-alanyl-D-glutamate endopeptidase CwlK